MVKPWYQKLFRRPEKTALETTQVRAEKGDADAQFSLGFKCASLGGGGQDYPNAAEWYLKAADQSHPLAQFNLGVMYAKGQGVPQDDVQAGLWIGRAASLGDAGAQHSMGTRCHRASLRAAQSVESESKIEAYKWFQLAAAQGYAGSDTAFERVTLSMTREEVEEGNSRTAAFVAEKPNSSAAR